MLAALFHIHSISLSRATVHRQGHTNTYLCTHTHTHTHTCHFKFSLLLELDDLEYSHPVCLLPPFISVKVSGRSIYSVRKEGNSPSLLGETDLSQGVTYTHSPLLCAKHTKNTVCRSHVANTWGSSIFPLFQRQATLPSCPLASDRRPRGRLENNITVASPEKKKKNCIPDVLLWITVVWIF